VDVNPVPPDRSRGRAVHQLSTTPEPAASVAEAVPPLACAFDEPL